MNSNKNINDHVNNKTWYYLLIYLYIIGIFILSFIVKTIFLYIKFTTSNYKLILHIVIIIIDDSFIHCIKLISLFYLWGILLYFIKINGNIIPTYIFNKLFFYNLTNFNNMVSNKINSIIDLIHIIILGLYSLYHRSFILQRFIISMHFFKYPILYMGDILMFFITYYLYYYTSYVNLYSNLMVKENNHKIVNYDTKWYFFLKSKKYLFISCMLWLINVLIKSLMKISLLVVQTWIIDQLLSNKYYTLITCLSIINALCLVLYIFLNPYSILTISNIISFIVYQAFNHKHDHYNFIYKLIIQNNHHIITLWKAYWSINERYYTILLHKLIFRYIANRYLYVIHHPNNIILITGWNGSGKTLLLNKFIYVLNIQDISYDILPSNISLWSLFMYINKHRVYTHSYYKDRILLNWLKISHLSHKIMRIIYTFNTSFTYEFNSIKYFNYLNVFSQGEMKKILLYLLLTSNYNRIVLLDEFFINVDFNKWEWWSLLRYIWLRYTNKIIIITHVWYELYHDFVFDNL